MARLEILESSKKFLEDALKKYKKEGNALMERETRLKLKVVLEDIKKIKEERK